MAVIARIVHLSDPHLGPLPQVQIRDLIGKRISGYLNWRFRRAHLHDMPMLGQLVADALAQQADAVCCTGDVANIGMAGEFETARSFLDSLGPRNQVSFVPGNHDVYVSGSLDSVFQHLRPWMSGDMPAGTPFPYIKRHGGFALIGLCSGLPTAMFRADGELGEQQLAATGDILSRLGGEGVCRVVMIHHPPHVGGAKPGRGLRDAAAFETMLASHGAELVLHGHNHLSSLTYLAGPQRQVPVLGVPSLSNRTGIGLKRAGYHLIEIATARTGYDITATTRGITEKGTIGPIGALHLMP